MEFTKTLEILSVFSCGPVSSTNDEARSASDAIGAGSWAVFTSTQQHTGRGRLGRQWRTPPHQALAASFLTPAWSGEGAPVTWAPLLAGIAVKRTVRDCVQAELKWPNDVLTPGGRKLAGILTELLPDGRLVVGIGVNISASADTLAEVGGASLRSEIAAKGQPDAVPESLDTEAGQNYLDGFLARLSGELIRLVEQAHDDPAHVREIVQEELATIGREVTATLPGGETLTGRAIGLGAAGELVIQQGSGDPIAVNAADVQHLRPSVS